MSEKMSPLAQLMYDAIHDMRVANMTYSDLKSYHFGVQDAWGAVSKALRELDEVEDGEPNDLEGDLAVVERKPFNPAEPRDPFADEMDRVRHQVNCVEQYIATHGVEQYIATPNGQVNLSNLMARHLNLGNLLRAAAVLVVAHKRGVKIKLVSQE